MRRNACGEGSWVEGLFDVAVAMIPVAPFGNGIAGEASEADAKRGIAANLEGEHAAGSGWGGLVGSGIVGARHTVLALRKIASTSSSVMLERSWLMMAS